MSYFKYFPQVDYRFGENTTTTRFDNISLYSSILDQIEDESTAYRLIQVRDGERADVLSHRLYDTTDLHWTFYLLNEKLRNHGWPLSQVDLLKKIEEDIPGECAVIYGSVTTPEGYKQHITVGNFPVGSNVIGTLTGATGVVYAKNPLLGQIFIRKTNNIAFSTDEGLRDVQTLTTATISRLHNPAYLAIRSVENVNGVNVDVDYSENFETTEAGGVFDDPTNRNIYDANTPYVKTTFYEHYLNLNDDLSKIKVLVPSVAAQINTLFRNSLNNG